MPSTHQVPKNHRPGFLSRKNNNDGDFLDLENEIVVLSEDELSDQSAVEDFSTGSSSSDKSDASEVPSEAGELLFNPSLSTQRHQMVLNILKEEKVKQVLDLGCNSLKFMSLVKSLPDLQFLAGVDLDKDILEEYRFLACPPACKWLEERPENFLIELWHGDVTDWAGAGVMENRVEIVTSIELIEHLQPASIEHSTWTVLGVIKPRMWIVTTPNKDYNELFPDWPGMGYFPILAPEPKAENLS